MVSNTSSAIPFATSSDRPWPAPAKLNLFLHVLGRRDDGYHNLQTLFQFLDYGDALEFKVRQDGLVNRSVVSGGDQYTVAAQDDLIVRAAKLLQAHTQCKLGVDIRLQKQLPMGGGLGGGSSDAATCLVALNDYWGLNLDRQKLCDLALQLGADVPIFVSGHAAWAEGVGERLTSVELPEPWYVVVRPAVSISTAELFTSPDLTRNARSITIRDYFAGVAVNAFEKVARKRHREVHEMLNWLKDTAGNGRMTGTGSCVFAEMSDESAATALIHAMPTGWQAFCAKGLNESPLIRRLNGEIAKKS